MLADMLLTRQAQFSSLAHSWISAGATAFGVWSDGHPLAWWADGQGLQQPSLVAPIRIGNRVAGDLRVAGVSGPMLLDRLMAEAMLIEQVIHLEGELRQMTSDLVDSQDQLLTLYDLSHSLHSYLTTETLLPALVREAARLTRASSSFAVFLSGEGEPIVAQFPPETFDEELIWSLFWRAQSDTHDSLVLEQPADELPGGIANVCLMRMRLKEPSMALLSLVNKPGDFRSADVRLGRSIADQVSVRIENVLLYQEQLAQVRLESEMELARRVQTSLLPRALPKAAGLDLYASVQPALQVGGDFYDFVDRPEFPLVFSVGDIAGKGVSAALLMTMTRLAINSKASFLPNPTPEAIIRQSNEDLHGDFLRVGSFATVFVGQYLPQQQIVRYANAGHSPVIYRPLAGEATLLRADSPPLGIFATHGARTHAVALRPGDLLIIATDGWCDACDAHGVAFGYERLLRLVDTLAEELADEPAEAIGAALRDTMTYFTAGAQQNDDQTMVVIKGVRT